MPKTKYALEKGQQPRLEISWKMGWKDITIKLDGLEIGKIADKKELAEGRDFTLDKNATLRVQLVKKGISGESLEVLINGQPIPGSSSDPNRRLAVAYGLVFFVAGMNVLLGLIAELVPVGILLNMGIGIYSVIFGLLTGIMGFLVWKRHSSVALGVAVSLLIIDGILGLIAGSLTGVAARIFLLIPMFGGFSAIKELKEQSKMSGRFGNYK